MIQDRRLQSTEPTQRKIRHKGDTLLSQAIHKVVPESSRARHSWGAIRWPPTFVTIINLFREG